MLTVYTDIKERKVEVCGEDEKVSTYDIKDFYKNFTRYLKDTTVFVSDFQMMSLFFIQGLRDEGYADATAYELSYDGRHKLEKDTFTYLLSSDSHSFFSISYRSGRDTIRLLEMKNMLSIEMEDIVKDFGGSPAVASYRAIDTLRRYAPRSKTISSCAYSSWKSAFPHGLFERLFQDIDKDTEKLCRDAYHGGMCMVKPGYAGLPQTDGFTLDVNSLYPYIMSTRRFAVGQAHHGYGELPDHIRNSKKTTFFVRIRAQFDIKPDHVPFLRTRCDKRHWPLETLTTSAYFDSEGERYDLIPSPGNEYVDQWGEIHTDVKPITVELALYKPELELMYEQYDVHYIEYIEYAWWDTDDRIFKDYVSFWHNLKKTAKNPSERRIAKLMLNALSGRMSLKIKRTNACLRTDVERYLDSYGTIHYKDLCQSIRGKYTPMSDGISPMIDSVVDTTSQSKSHIQIGAAITSEAMCYMVRIIQQNYDQFRYTDTDSFHGVGKIEDLKGVKIGKELGEFKIEHDWAEATYYQDKVYTMVDTSSKASVTWAGMPKECQKIVATAIEIMSAKKYYGVHDSEEKMAFFDEHVVAPLWKIARPKDIPDDIWDMTIHAFESREIERSGELFKASVPYTRWVVESYKDFKFSKKIECYRVDILTR